MNRVTLLKIFVWLYCLSWAFDFRGEDGGTLIQYVFFAFTLGTAGMVMLLGARSLWIRPAGWLIVGWSLYLASTLVVAQVNGVEMGWYLRNLIPPLLLLLSMCVTQIAAGQGLSYKEVLYPMLLAGVINVLWRAVYTLVIQGTPMDLVRVQMLSQCLPMLLAFTFAALALRLKWPLIPMLIGFIGISSYVVSITRSAVFIISAEMAMCVVAVWRARQLGVLPRAFHNTKVRHLVAGVGALLGVLVIVGVAAPFVFERWSERLFNPIGGEQSSADPSALTRFAETEAFMTLLNAEPATYLYGRGLGATYYWDESYMPELAQYTYGNEDVFRGDYTSVNFPGHSIWTYALFSGGIIGLGFYAGLFLVGTYWAYRSVRHLVAVPEYPLEIAFLPCISLVGFLSLSLTFNPFIERASAITIGVMFAFPQFLIMAAWRKGRKGT